MKAVRQFFMQRKAAALVLLLALGGGVWLALAPARRLGWGVVLGGGPPPGHHHGVGAQVGSAVQRQGGGEVVGTRSHGPRVSAAGVRPVPGRRGPGHQLGGDAAGVPAGQPVEFRGQPAPQEPHPLAGDRRAARQGLQAPAVATPAQTAVGDHPQVPDLGADPEGTAVQPTAEHQPAADAGADGDQQQVVDVGARAEAELAPGRDVGVVLHHDRQAEVALELGTADAHDGGAAGVGGEVQQRALAETGPGADDDELALAADGAVGGAADGLRLAPTLVDRGAERR